MGYGSKMQDAKRQTFLSLGSFTANTAVVALPRFGVGATDAQELRIASIEVCCSAVPSDADGVLTLTATVNDVSEGAGDVVVAAADLETLVTAANRFFPLTLAAEGSEKERTLQAGDSLRFTLTSDSAAIDTNPEVNVLVTYFVVPDYDEKETVQHRSEYVA